jgi:hypothetical protein
MLLIEMLHFTLLWNYKESNVSLEDSEWQQTVDTISVTALVGQKLTPEEFSVHINGQYICVALKGLFQLH